MNLSDNADFVNWQLNQGRAISSINRSLSTIRKYATLAMKAGALNKNVWLQIKIIGGFSRSEGKQIDSQRQQTRIGAKKAHHTRLTPC